MNNTGKFLPIGTVVILKGGAKRLMITGFCSFDQANKEKAYDYCGCLYPEGIISSSEMALFNHNQIEKIFFIGYSDEEEKNFKIALSKTIMEEMNKQTVVNSTQQMKISNPNQNVNQ